MRKNLLRVSVKSASAWVRDCSGGGLCKFHLPSSVQGTFTIGTRDLALRPSTPAASGVSGCFGIVSSGASPTFIGNFDVQMPRAAPPIGVIT
jgi:hypothetical protein